METARFDRRVLVEKGVACAIEVSVLGNESRALCRGRCPGENLFVRSEVYRRNSGLLIPASYRGD
jgi:D-alanine-D-alanine ligase-like ATP-grasp enzyme